MTIKANIHDAKTNLSRLIEKALAGEEVIIAKAGKPLVKLMPVEEAKPEYGAWLGTYPGRIELPSDAEWKAMDAEIEADFYAEDLDDELNLPDGHSDLLKGVAED